MLRKLVLVFFAILSSLCLYKVANQVMAVYLISKSSNLTAVENYPQALILLHKAGQIASLRATKKHIELEVDKNLALKADKQNYDRGAYNATINDWKNALDFWDKIPSTSLYYSKVIEIVDVPHAKPSGGNVKLINYLYAKDPTWNQLIDFLKEDKTDDISYDEDSFVCTGFAETLHNNAERAGIKAAYIGIRFPTDPGHAVDAFNTTNKGLVYIDATGKGYSAQRDTFLEDSKQNCDWDKIAYLETGKGYGTISTSYALVDPTSYEAYDNYSSQWALVESKLVDVSDLSKTYDQKNKVYEQHSFDYTGNLEEYLKRAEKFNAKVKTYQEENSEKFKVEGDEIKNDFTNWEGKKTQFEKSLMLFNADVKEYNESGKGNYDELKARQQDLNEQEVLLNTELENLNKAREDFNKKVNETNTKLEDERMKLSHQQDGLRVKLSKLEEERAWLDKTAASLNKDLSSLKAKELELGACYWKSLGVVKKIEVYW